MIVQAGPAGQWSFRQEVKRFLGTLMINLNHKGMADRCKDLFLLLWRPLLSGQSMLWKHSHWVLVPCVGLHIWSILLFIFGQRPLHISLVLDFFFGKPDGLLSASWWCIGYIERQSDVKRSCWSYWMNNTMSKKKEDTVEHKKHLHWALTSVGISGRTWKFKIQDKWLNFVPVTWFTAPWRTFQECSRFCAQSSTTEGRVLHLQKPVSTRWRENHDYDWKFW